MFKEKSNALAAQAGIFVVLPLRYLNTIAAGTKGAAPRAYTHMGFGKKPSNSIAIGQQKKAPMPSAKMHVRRGQSHIVAFSDTQPTQELP